jgi:hypothetical protein
VIIFIPSAVKMFFTRSLLSCVFFMFILHSMKCEEKKKVVGKKNIVDLNDADVEKLYEQWEVSDFHIYNKRLK